MCNLIFLGCVAVKGLVADCPVGQEYPPDVFHVFGHPGRARNFSVSSSSVAMCWLWKQDQSAENLLKRRWCQPMRPWEATVVDLLFDSMVSSKEHVPDCNRDL